MVANINDLRYAFYGGGADAEYADLAEANTLGITARDLILSADAQNKLADGEEVYQRQYMSTAVTLPSGTWMASYFTARKTEAITKVRFAVTTAQTVASVARAAVYSVAANGDLTQVAASNHSATLWQSTTFSHADSAAVLSTTFNKVAGTRYAVGFVVVTAGTAPVFGGVLARGGGTLSATPRMTARLAGQTDLPSSPIAAGGLLNSDAIWCSLEP